jgi:hypothetical protein
MKHVTFESVSELFKSGLADEEPEPLAARDGGRADRPLLG